MDIESLRAFCKTLPAVTEDIKWVNDLCFSVGGKMFCVAGLESPCRVSFKLPDEDYDELSSGEMFFSRSVYGPGQVGLNGESGTFVEKRD